MICKALPLLALAALLFLTATTSVGDTLILKRGGKFEGKVIKETSSYVIFKIRGMGEQKFKKSDILRIEKGKSVFDEYSERRGALSDDDAAGLYELGVWCKENDLRKEAKKAFQDAIEADPDHAGAREELGYVQHEFEWITKKRYDEIMAELMEREGSIIEGFELGDPVTDEDTKLQVRAPKGEWKTEAEAGIGFTFTGPELGKAPVTIRLERVPEDATLAENLDEFVTSCLEKLDEEFEKWKKGGDPVDDKLAGAGGKAVTSTYLRDDIAPETIAMERRDVIVKVDDAYLRYSIECRKGYFAKLSPFFGKVKDTVKFATEEAPAAEGGAGAAAGPVEELPRSFDVSPPDDTYAVRPDRSLGFAIRTNQGNVGFAAVQNSVVIASKTTRAYMIANEGKLAEGATLAGIKDNVKNILNVRGILETTGEDRTLKVAGVDALAGNLSIARGGMGSGYWTVFKKGDRYYMCVFLNMMNQMGEQYAKPDYQKFLDSFKFK